MLDIECFSFLNKALESSIAPIVVLATNRGVAPVRYALAGVWCFFALSFFFLLFLLSIHLPFVRSGTDLTSPHGVPVDLLDRCLIIRTLPYSPQECVDIVAIRAKIEGTQLDDASLAHLGKIAERASLRYAVQLLSLSNIVARVHGRTTITKQDVEEVDTLFYDAKASAKLLEKNPDSYLQ